MTYNEIKQQISDCSITYLPGLLQHVARQCGLKPVFRDKEAMMRFVSRAFDMGPEDYTKREDSNEVGK